MCNGCYMTIHFHRSAVGISGLQAGEDVNGLRPFAAGPGSHAMWKRFGVMASQMVQEYQSMLASAKRHIEMTTLWKKCAAIIGRCQPAPIHVPDACVIKVNTACNSRKPMLS